jgi:hypothetical protein
MIFIKVNKDLLKLLYGFDDLLKKIKNFKYR